MPTSGLVLTLDPARRREALAWLSDFAPLTLGDAVQERLPVVLEADDAERAREFTDQLRAAPGVAHLEIVFVGLDDPQEEPG
jgi:nitrate reductase NapAB chaperone NapD